jgi:cytochrome c-type biogenesis protein CcmH
MSMGLAVALIGLTSLALAILLVPLLIRRQRAESRDAYNLAVYRDQLAEVERDLGRGVLTAEQADAARTEIGRRILALNPAAAAAGPSSAVPFATATAAVLLVPFAAWALYAMLGSPQLPDQPYASRGNNPPPATASAGQAPHTDMAEAVQKLTAHLKEHPEDLTGWVLLARSDMSIGRYQDGAEAYKHAVDLSNKRADIWGDWAEAVVLSTGGTVTPEAKQAFEAGLKDPDLAPRSRYYLALARMQQGDTKGALQAWVDLEADSPADADWLPMVRKRIEQTAASLGIDPATLKTSAGADRPKPVATAAATPPQHPPLNPPAANAPGAMPPNHPPVAAPTSPASAAPAPSSAPDPQKVREAQQALAGASPQDRQAMINSMVERLAARLEQQPDDVDGWSRLARSYAVLNQPAKARDAYARAVKLRPDDIGLKQGYAEAIISAAGDDATAPPTEATALFRQILAAEPKNQMALWYVGLAEADAGHKDMARDLLSRLLTELPANAPGRQEVEQRLAGLKQGSN